MSNELTTCKICKTPSSKIFSGTILKKYAVGYFQCPNCGFAQTEEPYWLNESYSESMNFGDTGQISRNLNASKVLLPLIHYFFNREGKYLDYAGGYGMFTRMMRDIGIDYFWDDKYTKNLIGLGFERSFQSTQFELVSTFECFEHWVDPLIEIEGILKETDSIFFTTNLISRPAPKPDDWWYYGFDHGQHVAFHSADSLKFVAQKFGLYFYTKRGFHLLTKKKINKLAYKLLVELALRGCFFWLQSRYQSRTQSDHELLVARKASL